MPKTAVALLENADTAHRVVRDLEDHGFPPSDLRVLSEARYSPIADTMSSPRNDFQVSLNHDLRAIGATELEAKAYVQGVRRGAVLVFASGPDDRIDDAAEIMNRHRPLAVEELMGGELHLPSGSGAGMAFEGGAAAEASRNERYPGAGARIHVT